MSAINIRSILPKLNKVCQETLHSAVALCSSRLNDYIEVEHWLAALAERTDIDFARVVRHYDLNPGRVSRELTAALDRLRRGRDSRPGWSLSLEQLLRESWALASLEYAAPHIRSGFLLAALVTDRDLSQRLRDCSPELARLPGEQMVKELRAVIAGSAEDALESSAAAVAGAPAAQAAGGPAG